MMAYMPKNLREPVRGLEPLFSYQELSSVFNVSIEQVRKILANRKGIINVGSGKIRPAWRVPRSLVLEVLAERGGKSAEQHQEAAADQPVGTGLGCVAARPAKRRDGDGQIVK